MLRRQIKIFLADGSPSGLRVAQLGLSTLKAVVAPRTKLSALKQREEAERTGVYILRGPDPERSGWVSIYVGEGDNVYKRIHAHDRDEGKEFWEEVVLLVSKDDNLTKAHVRFLEAELVKLGLEAKRATIVNGNAPNGGQLPEADHAEMEELMEHILLLLGTLGFDAFQLADSRPAENQLDGDEGSDPDGLELSLSGNGFAAKCLLRNGEFVVLAGSLARLDEAPSLSAFAKNTRFALSQNGVLTPGEGGLVFRQDYSFRSASGAAAVVSGTTISGKSSWKLKDETTLREWEEAQAGDEE